MTTIASFISISDAGKKNLSMISDSRISWTVGKGKEEQLKSKFDYSQKIFQLDKTQDVLGYCGDSLFCLSNISRIVSYLNKSEGFLNSDSIENKKNIINEILDDSLKHYPIEELNHNFMVLWNSLHKEKLSSFCFKYKFDSKEFKCYENTIPLTTGLVFYEGSGRKFYLSALGNLRYREGYNYSRTYFRALVDVIESMIDFKTGGPPQMITINQNIKSVVPSSILYKGHYYLNGVLDIFQSDLSDIEVRDCDFNYLTYDGKQRNNYNFTSIRKLELNDWKKKIKSS